MRVTQTTITVANTTTAVLSAEQKRRHLLLINDSDETIYVGIGKPAVMNEGVRINSAGGSYEMIDGSVYLHAINAICASGGKKLLVTQGL